MATAASRLSSSRSRALAAGAAVALLAVLVAAGALVLRDDGDDGRRAAAERYVHDVNTVQVGAAIELDRISRAYEELRLDPAALRAQEEELAEAERTIRRLRARVRAVPAPAEAARVHAEVLRFLAMQVELAAEVAQLARYVPLWAEQEQGLAAATERLRKDLRAAQTSKAQQRAFGHYTTSVGEALESLSALDAPAVLEPPRREQVARLRRVHRLSGEVRDALGRPRPETAEPLFRRLAEATSAAETNRTQRAAVVEYNRRIRLLGRQRLVVERELTRLNAALR